MVSRDAELAVVRGVIPKKVFNVHRPVLPVPYGAHRQVEGLPRRRDCFSVGRSHRNREGSLHETNDAGPFFACNLDGVHLDPCVWGIDKERFQVSDMLIDAMCGMAIRPIDCNVVGMALFEAVPLRARENVIVQRVECREMLLRKLSRRLILFEVGRLIRRLCG